MADHCQNASPARLPTASVSITSQEAASCGLLSSSRKTCLFHENIWGEGVGYTYFLPSLGRRFPGSLVGLHVSLTPFFFPFLAPSPFLPLSLSVPNPEGRKFCLSPDLTTSFMSGATLSYLSPFILLLPPPPKFSFVELGGKKFSNPQCNLPTHLTLCLHAFMDSTHFTEGL